MPTLQQRLDARGTVVLTGQNIIDQPLIIKSRTNLIGEGGASIKTTYVGPAIKTGIGESVTNFSIKQLFFEGGGIEFPPEGAANGFYPSFFELSDLFISGAPIAFNDSYSGAWMGRIERVFAAAGSMGFRVYGGTTKTFSECHVAGGTNVAWEFFCTHSCRLINCAVDIRDLEFSAATFSNCRGLSLDSFYFENNKHRGGAFMQFNTCDALSISNMYSLSNELIAPVNGGVYLVQVHGCNGVLNAVSLGGGTRALYDKATGSGTGHTVPLLLTGMNNLALNGCHIAPARKYVTAQTGFSFLNNSGVGSNVSVNGCLITPALAPGQPDPYL